MRCRELARPPHKFPERRRLDGAAPTRASFACPDRPTGSSSMAGRCRRDVKSTFTTPRNTGISPAPGRGPAPPAGPWRPCRPYGTQQLVAPADRVDQNCQAIANVFVDEVVGDSKGNLYHTRAKTVPDARDGSIEICKDRHRRGQCLKARDTDATFLLCPLVDILKDVTLRPVASGPRRLTLPAPYPFVPSHETPGLRSRRGPHHAAARRGRLTTRAEL